MDKQGFRPLMLGGTGSDVGKSILVAGLCRVFKQDGYNPAPFKAQNMALNSYVTADGLELGRAQAMQAEAAGIECLSEMNPVLLKPIGDCVSQVILNGKPIGNRSARDYFNSFGRKALETEVHSAFDRLSKKYNPIVMEGAGSVAELNLMHLDIVNMPMARYANAAVIIVADISRGGIFASAYGSIVLQKPDDRRRIKGVIVNKFRGDVSLFEEGRKQLEEICGVPVIGVMPYLEDIGIEEEDSYFYKKRHSSSATGKIKVAIVKLPHISNFTDFDPLEKDPRIDLYYTINPDEIDQSDVIILPGTKATTTDMVEICRNGMAKAIVDANKKGKTVIGICGGYQMMGNAINDPDGVEGDIPVIKGLGLLPVETTITKDKRTRRINFKPWRVTQSCRGYEIHMGKTVLTKPVVPFAVLEDGSSDGCVVSERCFGTYLHGLFENKCVVDAVFSHLSPEVDSDFDYYMFKQSQYDKLAAEIRKHLDIDMIYKIMREND